MIKENDYIEDKRYLGNGIIWDRGFYKSKLESDFVEIKYTSSIIGLYAIIISIISMILMLYITLF